MLNINLTDFDPKPPSGARLNYIFRLINNNSAIQNEKFESISLINSNVIRIYKKSLTYPSSNNISVLTDILNDSIYYVAINLEVIYDNNKELFSYSYLNNPANYEVKKEESKSTVIIF